MGMNVGGSKRAVQPRINVTPLVDVVLVLLIIFMVVTPLMLKQFPLNVPKKPEQTAAPVEPEASPDPPLVLAVRADGGITLNNDSVALGDLVPKLQRVFAARKDHVLFFDAADEVAYGRAAEVLDAARSGHAVTIAVITEPLNP